MVVVGYRKREKERENKNAVRDRTEYIVPNLSFF